MVEKFVREREDENNLPSSRRGGEISKRFARCTLWKHFGENFLARQH
jgi:hypothetical protein